MKAESAGAFTRAIESRNYGAGKIHHLTLGVDTKSGSRVVDNGHGPGRIERRRLDFVLRRGLREIRVVPSVHKRVVTRDSAFEHSARYGFVLILVYNRGG